MISLIIPTLNEAKVISKTLAGLDNDIKTKYNVEVIISDGGSTDGTQELVRKLGVRLVEADESKVQNIAVGRNAGAELANGQVLIFLDADTYPESWSKLFEGAIKIVDNKKLVAGTVSVEISPEERKFKDIIWQNLFNLVFFCENAIGIGMGRGNCQIVRTDAFRRIGGYNINLAAAEDYDLYRRLTKIGKIKILWHVVVYESPRRFRKYGYLKVVWWWTLNGASVLFKNRAWSKKWKRVS